MMDGWTDGPEIVRAFFYVFIGLGSNVLRQRGNSLQQGYQAAMSLPKAYIQLDQSSSETHLVCEAEAEAEAAAENPSMKPFCNPFFSYTSEKSSLCSGTFY